MSESFAKRFVAGWNNHDGAALAALFGAEGTFEDVPRGVVSKGRDAIKTLVGDTELWSRDFWVTLVSEQVSAGHHAIEWEMGGDAHWGLSWTGDE
jgi:hypothetical protein